MTRVIIISDKSISCKTIQNMNAKRTLTLILQIFILNTINGTILIDVEFFHFEFSAFKHSAWYREISCYFNAKYNFLATIVNGYWILSKEEEKEIQFWNTTALSALLRFGYKQTGLLVELDQMLLWPINKRCTHNGILGSWTMSK